MSNNSLKEIEQLIPELPKKDITLGYKFLLSRDFESLQSLINSAIIKIERNARKENPKEEYLSIDLEKLEELKVLVDDYYSMIEITEEDIDIYDDLDPEEINEDENYYY